MKYIIEYISLQYLTLGAIFFFPYYILTQKWFKKGVDDKKKLSGPTSRLAFAHMENAS
jgi:hypothetical protein